MIDTRDGAGKAEKKPCAPARCELKEKKKERKNDTMPFDWVSSGWKKKYFAAISPHIMTSNQLFSPWPLLPLGKVVHIPRELIVCKQHKNYLN